MSTKNSLHLFEAFGVELEYMIVDAHSLQVKPIADQVIYSEVGAYLSDVEFGSIAWSNELVLHVLELKTNGPAKDLTSLAALFQEHVRKINQILEKFEAKLLPTGMHPFMDPHTETKIWPHDYNAVYEAYNKIFDCKGHGWANLQSTHLNLPFANEEEFGRLHAAIRLVLPIIPALSASTPIKEEQVTGIADTRLDVYRSNQQKIPSIAGSIIPEAVFTRQAYEDTILKKIYKDIAPHDPEGMLQDEFLNSRGAIARFSRNAIEIRLLDIQESPVADLAILEIITCVIKLLVQEKWVSLKEQQSWHQEELSEILLEVIEKGQDAIIHNWSYISCFGIKKGLECKAGDLWKHLVDQLLKNNLLSDPVASVAHIMLTEGNLSKRITAALLSDISPEAIKNLYGHLADCLEKGEVFSLAKYQNHKSTS
ncbi:carboxylate-amine ligase [Adhaeribacter aquaticus]|uniref:carboxylate-amine ligase n=1 Tax=Adhaeribacter aquaticus TaxID=299567 RepID=UPI000401A169|nr:glutamate-cysteine ligase family protein [Adhaeribacter aquaticus]